MDVFTLFHGSEAIVSKPEIGLCRPYNDYGKGFYCTADQELGKEWACQKGRDGFVSCYELPLDGLVAIDLNGEGFTALHWLSVLFENRLVRLTTPVMERGGRWLQDHFSVDLDGADIVAGYRADDSYFGFARAFLSNSITLGQLTRALRLGNLGTQVMLKSPAAFDAVRFTGYVKADAATYFPRYSERDARARAEFAQMIRSSEDQDDGLFFSSLMAMGKEELDGCLR